MDWQTFGYLNGVRKNNESAMKMYEEYDHGFRTLGIATPKGQIEQQMAKVIVEMAKLNTILMAKIEHERSQDISLWLNDI
ncbi:hypothetical protein [Flavobacterium sp.]|jgi:hypothetical protein|uniref:hypothetical protein n=1 Tax=Flavobacterium sp. TaxID=239 RepID=UPI0037C0B290